MPSPVINLTMKDGSRHFWGLPAEHDPKHLWRGVKQLSGAEPGDYASDMIETWFDFTYRGRSFSVHETFGEFWFFANDPNTPEQDLHDIRAHVLAYLGLERDI